MIFEPDLFKIILLIILILFGFGFVYGRNIKSKINIKNVLIVLAIFTAIIIIALINVKFNGVCKLKLGNMSPFEDIPQVKCNVSCYCDGLGNSSICLGVYRGICAQ